MEHDECQVPCNRSSLRPETCVSVRVALEFRIVAIEVRALRSLSRGARWAAAPAASRAMSRAWRRAPAARGAPLEPRLAAARCVSRFGARLSCVSAALRRQPHEAQPWLMGVVWAAAPRTSCIEAI